MLQPHQFAFSRERGLAWVCDIAGSTKYLNDDALAEAIEEFLPRFNWLARLAVETAGGGFVKWTGDGFLAWFPFELHREIGIKASAIFDMIWHLTLLCNVTSLEVATSRKFLLRHGVAIEHDALVTHIRSGQTDAIDLIGRGVVLAFRLSAIKAPFPGIVTQREILAASADKGATKIHFKSFEVRANDKLRYFKGEKFGTMGLVASAERSPKPRSTQSVIRHIKKAIARAEQKTSAVHPNVTAITTLLDHMRSGPRWAADAAAHYLRFVSKDMLGTLKASIPLLEGIEQRHRQNGRL